MPTVTITLEDASGKQYEVEMDTPSVPGMEKLGGEPPAGPGLSLPTVSKVGKNPYEKLKGPQPTGGNTFLQTLGHDVMHPINTLSGVMGGLRGLTPISPDTMYLTPQGAAQDIQNKSANIENMGNINPEEAAAHAAAAYLMGKAIPPIAGAASKVTPSASSLGKVARGVKSGLQGSIEATMQAPPKPGLSAIPANIIRGIGRQFEKPPGPSMVPLADNPAEWMQSPPPIAPNYNPNISDPGVIITPPPATAVRPPRVSLPEQHGVQGSTLTTPQFTPIPGKYTPRPVTPIDPNAMDPGVVITPAPEPKPITPIKPKVNLPEGIDEESVKAVQDIRDQGRANDVRFAKDLKSRGVTPEAWLNQIGEEGQNIHLKKSGFRPLGKGGKLSRTAEQKARDIYDALSTEWGR